MPSLPIFLCGVVPFRVPRLQCLAVSLLVMCRRSWAILTLQLATLLLTIPSALGQPLETWSDSNLKVTQGLQVWIDSQRLPQAYAAENRKGGTSGNRLDTLFDASGNGHDFKQDNLSNQPRLQLVHGAPVIVFDGVDDFARTKTECVPASEFSLYVLASIESNQSNFPALLSTASYGQNDYITGLNVDLGSAPTPTGDLLSLLNVEGNGFSGVRNLLKTPIAFSKFHLIELHKSADSNSLQLVLDGVAQNSRDASSKPIDLSHLWLGCRYYSNSNEPAHVSGFIDGKFAEVLMYNRTLNKQEASTVRTYLLNKHAGLISGNSDRSQGYLLQPLPKTPVVQMLLPGFAVEELPLSLTNINNIRYRRDGKLIAVGYNGNIFVLSDTDGDGIEETSKLFWDNQGRLRGPIGIALTPENYAHGNGVIVASKGKVSLILDSDGDDVADEEKIIATGWKEISQNVDAIGVAIAPDHSIYFGLGAANYANGYLIDDEGKSQFDLASERGTVQRISPDWSKRESICTGVRFPVAMAFNEQGDLFASEQEGATWLPNGNPLDELLHIQTGRHYGFPPRHPKHLPNVIDEPSVFDYAPQHQSTCGFIFNVPTENSDKIFGPSWWRGDAIVCGESRGKLFRTKTVRTPYGYVAQNQLIACLSMLTVDACVSPRGDLIVACHSGPPDWGTGPEGKGKLMRVRYTAPDSPQVVATWTSSDREISVAFDRSVDPATWKNALSKIQIEGGIFVAPGDRFEVLAPPYAVVQKQLSTLRYSLPVYSFQSAPDGRTVRLLTAPLQSGFKYAIQLPDLVSKPKASSPEIEQVSNIDLGVDLHGVEATWTNSSRTEMFQVWLPHLDLDVSRKLTVGSSQHAAFWEKFATEGEVTLRTRFDALHMLQPKVQPGSTLDYTPAAEIVELRIECDSLLKTQIESEPIDGNSTGTLIRLDNSKVSSPLIEITLQSGKPDTHLLVSFTTQESSQPRALALTRFIMPWISSSDVSTGGPTSTSDAAERFASLTNGRWLHGREIFFGAKAQCSKCHSIRGLPGGKIGPDLSNLVHRDRKSIERDLRDPNAALNPDHLSFIASTTDGRIIQGVPLLSSEEHFELGTAQGEVIKLVRADIESLKPSPASIMPSGLLDTLSSEGIEDLILFLMNDPLLPSNITRLDVPKPRTFGEFNEVMDWQQTFKSFGPDRPTKIVLVSGPKDHGIDEHDYPLWQQRWNKLLSLAQNIEVSNAEVWPTPDQLQHADLIVFYSANPGWSASRGVELDQYLQRGGGLVFMHFAVNGMDSADALASRIGLAANPRTTRYRHGELQLQMQRENHPLSVGLPNLDLVDESYWKMIGDPAQLQIVATAEEETEQQPLIWTVQRGKGRVFVSIMGHYSWTLDDPLYRVLLLRGMMWAADRSPDSLASLAIIGARIREESQSLKTKDE